MAKQKYYTVWHGRNTGVFDSWDACKASVFGFEGAQYKSFATKQEAEAALKQSYWKSVQKPAAGAANKTIQGARKPNLQSISVDAACSGNPGRMEYRGVWTESGEEIFRMGVYDDATNNIGEFLAIVHGLAWQKERGMSLPLYSDSVTAQSWIRKRKCMTKLEATTRNQPVFDLIRRAENWLLNNEIAITILKWDTEAWGEIPADFGRK